MIAGNAFSAAAMPLRALPDPEKAKPCVLVVDDDEAVAWAIASRLGATSASSALTDPELAVALACEEAPGVILCDIDMPACRAMKSPSRCRRSPHRGDPLVYLTAWSRRRKRRTWPACSASTRRCPRWPSSAELLGIVASMLGLDGGDASP
jgi:CheY-like chemotaxis protein